MDRKIKRYGWSRDLPDGRDVMYAAPMAVLTELPKRVDLRRSCPPVYNQGALGSCTANAIAAALQFVQMKQRQPKPFTPSRLFIYYNERRIERSIESDSGAMIRDGVKSVSKEGAPPESDWPYVVAKFRDKPPKAAYDHAKEHQSILYQRLTQTLNQMKGCLASGFPFVFGFVVYESFESSSMAKTGRLPMPAADEKPLGGHAVLAVGYDEAQQRFLVRNSWGPRWGLKGYFSMPYSYLLQDTLASDLWTIRAVE